MKYVWILLIIPLILISRWMVKNSLFERSILDWAIAILLIQVFVTCIRVPDIIFSLPKIAGVIYGLAFFYSIVALLDSEKLIKWGIMGFLGAGLMLLVVGILGMQWDKDIYFSKIILKFEKIIPKVRWNIPGAEEGFNANAIGGALILIIPLCLILFFVYLKGKKENYLIPYRLFPLIFFFVISFVMCSVLFFTLSFGSWIAVISSIWILLLPWKWKKWSFVLIFLLIALIFLSYHDGNKLLAGKNIENRKLLWSVGIITIIQHPLLGVGMNRIRQNPSVGYENSHVHNHFIHTAAELGIPGLVAYLAILIGAGYMCVQIWRISNIGWMRMMALGLGCGHLAHFIFGMMDSIPLGAKVGIFFWFSLALIASIYNYTIRNGMDAGRG